VCATALAVLFVLACLLWEARCWVLRSLAPHQTASWFATLALRNADYFETSDPWGHRWRVVREGCLVHGLVSAGPDGLAETRDDLRCQRDGFGVMVAYLLNGAPRRPRVAFLALPLLAVLTWAATLRYQTPRSKPLLRGTVSTIPVALTTWVFTGASEAHPFDGGGRLFPWTADHSFAIPGSVLLCWVVLSHLLIAGPGPESGSRPPKREERSR